MISSLQSDKFKFWAFISMVLLVFVHGYNLQERYLQPWSMPAEPMTVTAFIEYFLANGLFRFRIPMLFIISGFLFALQDEKPQKERINKRIKTLLIPYLLWSFIGFSMVYLFELWPVTQNLIKNSHIVQIDENRLLLHDYTWYEALARIIFFPIPYQLWFIRVLFIYNLAYPAIKWSVFHPKYRWVFFGLVFVMWLSNLGLGLVEGEGLLFFSIGILIQKTNFDILNPKPWLRPHYWIFVFLLFTSVKTWLAFNGQSYTATYTPFFLLIMHKLVVFSGLVSAWFGLDKFVKWSMDKKWFVWFTSFTFIIYVLHAPFVAIAIDGFFAITQGISYFRGLVFLILPLATILLCIIVGLIIRNLSPKLYGLLTGGRGFYSKQGT